MTETADMAPHDPVLSEVKSLREVMNTRFDAVQREQDMFGEIIDRMSVAIERLSDGQARNVSVEQRLAHAEAELSDFKLDQAAILQDLQALKDEKTKTTIVRDGIMASVGGILSAIVMQLMGIGK